MLSRFHLYPHAPEEQRLGASASLVYVHELDGFGEAIAPFGVVVEPVAPEDQVLGKWQEFSVRPPLPRERVKQFGDTLVRFAEGHSLNPDGVAFVDHTDPIREELQQAILRKVGPAREAEEA
ncbi:MAG TPA: hypothetical protein VG964_04305 [Candidatus Saccharimonadales bacterium]|nr:hypothetical protein [Candidatus Saccharimonadales bacterium]